MSNALPWGPAVLGAGLIAYWMSRGNSGNLAHEATNGEPRPGTPPPSDAATASSIGIVHVFWDIENCQVPVGIHPSAVVQNIRALRTSRGYSPSRIVAAVAKGPLSVSLRRSLVTLGVDLLDCSSSKPSAADLLLLDEVQRFTLSHDPVTSGVIFITSDIDFGRRLTVLKQAGYDVSLVHQENISETLGSLVNHRLLWRDLCRGNIQEFNGRAPARDTVALNMVSGGPACPAAVPLDGSSSRNTRSEKTSDYATVPPIRSVRQPFMDFFLVYELLFWISQNTFHLVPRHAYPEGVVATLQNLEKTGFVCLSRPLATNPVPAFIFILLMPKGEVMLQLLKEINLATDVARGRRYFRHALYHWIQQAFVRNEDSCRLSNLGITITPLLKDGTIVDNKGAIVRSVRTYYNDATVQGIFRLEAEKRTGQPIIALGEPFASSWRSFRRSDEYTASSRGGIQHTVCGERVARKLFEILGGFLRQELLFLPLLRMLRADEFTHPDKLSGLEKILGFPSGHLQHQALEAGLIYAADSHGCALTPTAVLLVSSFASALNDRA